MKAHFERKAAPKSGLWQPSVTADQPQAPASLPKTALLWGIGPDHPAMIPLRAAGRLGLTLRTVTPQELNTPVGTLCGIPGAAKQAAGPDAAAAAKPDSPAAGAAARSPSMPGDPTAGTVPVTPAMPGVTSPLSAAAVPAGPALILCGLPGAEREALLDALRAAGAVIPLKAIVTPTNQSWPFAALLAELAREHAALHGTA